MDKNTYDYIIIGAGIIGLTIADTLKKQKPDAKILIIEKEDREARHSSGRNSGVLHAGFYYSADSFKAKFTVEGNNAMKEFCAKNNVPINACGKLVVAQNEEELQGLFELERRGKINGSNVKLIDEDMVGDFDPNVKTFKKALYSPDTASIDPAQVCKVLRNLVVKKGIEVKFNAPYTGRKGNTLTTKQGDFSASKKIVNCAGLYADKVAYDFGFGKKYTIMPFKGLYLKYTKNKTDVKINIYPVPNLKNPFLGVHYTKTVDQGIKIGPTAIPAFWRENYTFTSNFKINEFASIMFWQAKLFTLNSFGFRDLGIEEMKKYYKKYFVGLAVGMVKEIDPTGFTKWSEPGIRAQLLNRKTNELVQDFVVEGDDKSVHVLNAVSPAYTCAFPFSEFIVNKYIL